MKLRLKHTAGKGRTAHLTAGIRTWLDANVRIQQLCFVYFKIAIHLIRENLISARSVALVGILLLSISFIQAANRYSVATNNWNSTSTWSETSGGTSGASVPVAGDDVYIENGHNVTVTANVTCDTLTFSKNGNSTLTINSGITLAVTGNVIASSNENTNRVYLVTGGGTLTCASFSVGSEISPTNDHSTTLTSEISTLKITGDLKLYGSAKGSKLNNIIVNLSTGTTTVNGSIFIHNEKDNIGGNNSNTATFNMNSGDQNGTLILGGATPFYFDSSFGISNITLNGTSSTVNYSYTGAQPIRPTLYTNLTISGNASKTLPPTTTVNGTLTVKAGATFDLDINNPGSPTSVVLECGASTAGSIITGTATSTPNGNITVNNVGTGANGATILCPVALTDNRTITVADDSTLANDLTINSLISGSYGITKEGVGSMVLLGANTYTGTTFLNAGTLKLGATGGDNQYPLRHDRFRYNSSYRSNT